MKVFCVSNKFQTNADMPKVPIGSEVTVIDEREFDGKEYWKFKEYDYDWPIYWYHKADFATLPPEEPAVVNEQEFEGVIYAR